MRRHGMAVADRGPKARRGRGRGRCLRSSRGGRPRYVDRSAGERFRRAMKVFVTGASGYIGGSVAAALLAAGHEVRGLVRTQERAAQVKGQGIAPVLGTLGD